MQRLATIAALVLLPVGAGPAAGQQQDWYRPIDQTVEDLDRLAVSPRVVEPGLAQFSDRVRLYQPLNPYQLDPFGVAGSESYILRDRGFRVWVPRPQYLSLVDPDPRRPRFEYNVSPVVEGAFLDVIPPGAVFDLTLPAAPPTSMDLDPANDPRLDLRLDYRLDTTRPLHDQPMPEPIVGYGNAIVISPSTPAPPRLAPPRPRPDPAPEPELTPPVEPEPPAATDPQPTEPTDETDPPA